MAEPVISQEETDNDGRQQHQELLWGLKFTVEGLLAAHTTNVWSTYGGLTRLCSDLDKVMCHRLRHPEETTFVVQEDYWEFVMGLRRLQPVLAPSVDRIHRQAVERGVDRGGMWLRTCLEAHTLATQLRLLVDDEEHLSKFYHDDAFLCSQAHFKALYICLLSVEQNNASLLADLDPMLLLRSLPPGSQQRNTSTRDTTAEMPIPPLPQRKLSASAEAVQPPAFTSPKSESILTMSDEHAQPTMDNLNRRKSDSARSMLLSLLDNPSGLAAQVRSLEDIPKTVNDPLMNMEFLMHDNAVSPPQRKVLKHAKTMSSLPSYAQHQHKESKLPFEYGSPPAVDKMPGSLGSGGSPLGSVHEEDTTTDVCQCHVKGRSYSDSTERDTMNSPSSLSTDSLNAIQCRVCGKSLVAETPSVVKLRGKQGAGSSSPKARNSLYKANKPHRHSQSSLLISESATKKNILRTHTRSKSDISVKPPPGYITGATEGLNLMYNSTSNSLPLESHIVPPRKNSLLETGIVSPATECYFPQPAQGQSLMSFLSSRDFERIPELDRENAHFSISEAIIAAIEQIRYKKQQSSVSDHESDASDEEIQHLKQRIRLRRNEKRRDKMRGRTSVVVWSTDHHSDSGMNTLTSSATTLTSSSANSTPYASGTESDEDSSDSTDSVEEYDLSDPQLPNLSTLQGMGLSASLASLYSDADICRPSSSPMLPSSESSGVNSNTLSAESVALCLLRKFSAKQLPAASELQWLVSEQDAPQALLPMPNSLPVSPDDGENADLYTKKTTRLRGNAEWAPPRAQIIFNVHPPPKRKVLVAKQNYRCAGCGMRIERGFAKKLRYCEYLGKYFCHSCHANCAAVIPGRALRKWDFQKVPVCNFSRELLEKMHEDPLFNIVDINQSLYRRVKSLHTCKELRTQLFFLKDFLKTCRLSQSLQVTYESQPSHLLSEPHVYSLSDLHRVRNGEMESELTQLVEDAVTHVSQCQLCQAKGFICEVCNNDQDIIFPFQLLKTHQCQGCWACYHKSCFLTVEACPKCVRINQRKISQSAKRREVFSDEEEELPKRR